MQVLRFVFINECTIVCTRDNTNNDIVNIEGGKKEKKSISLLMTTMKATNNRSHRRLENKNWRNRLTVYSSSDSFYVHKRYCFICGFEVIVYSRNGGLRLVH